MQLLRPFTSPCCSLGVAEGRAVVMDGQPWLYGTCPSRDFACVFRPWLLPATACHRLPPSARPACPTSPCLRTPPPGPARLRILSLPFSPSGWF
jgi:hypothetical protein